MVRTSYNGSLPPELPFFYLGTSGLGAGMRGGLLG
jgi:hypothetical protein